FIAAASGMLGPFIFSGKAAFWLAVPTSVFGMVLLPVAYLTFFLLMNQKKLLGKSMPTGMRRVRWNVLMAIAFFLSAIGSVWSVWSKARWYGVAGLAAFMLLVAVVHFLYPRKALPLAEELEPQRV